MYKTGETAIAAIWVNPVYIENALFSDGGWDEGEGEGKVEENTVEVGGLGDGIGDDGAAAGKVNVQPAGSDVFKQEVMDKYSASNLMSEITKFLVREKGVKSHDVLISCHNHVDVWHKLYLHHNPLPFVPFDPTRRDVVGTSAPVLDKCGRLQTPGV
ncbi:hypothetical protein BDV93DRAFT_506416 [Ceratobasidium sp. AG-I]|nr:hypothetical protein BDV93DRAFT_506416 [Ceratobasidium sp. AG-I]